MSAESHDLPPDVVDAVDAWLDAPDDEALDRLASAVAEAPALDGDLDARAARVAQAAGPSRSRSPWPWVTAAAGLAAVLALFLLMPRPSAFTVSPEEAAAPRLTRVMRGSAEGEGEGPRLQLLAPEGERVGDAVSLVLGVSPGPDGVPVDRGSLRVTYLRGDGVDLRARLQGTWSADRWVVDSLRLPPGEHPLEFTISDEELETSTLTVVLRSP